VTILPQVNANQGPEPVERSICRTEKALRDKVRSRTVRSRGDSLGQIIGDINPTLRCWFGYFQHAAPGVFRAIDGFVRRRLRAILRKQEKRPASDDARPITNADPMPSSLRTAQASARHSR
jgi:RNA-directed DNA polymerase